MSNPAASNNDLVGYAQTADIRQAEYYLRLLNQHRECVQTELAADQLALAEHFASHEFNRIRRLQRGIERQEKELHVLDRLIAALNARLARSR